MMETEALQVANWSILFAALGLVALLASADWRFERAISGAFTRDHAVQQRIVQLQQLQQLTEAADRAHATRKKMLRVTPDAFGRAKKSKKMALDHRD